MKKNSICCMAAVALSIGFTTSAQADFTVDYNPDCKTKDKIARWKSNPTLYIKRTQSQFKDPDRYDAAVVAASRFGAVGGSKFAINIAVTSESQGAQNGRNDLMFASSLSSGKSFGYGFAELFGSKSIRLSDCSMIESDVRINSTIGFYWGSGTVAANSTFSQFFNMESISGRYTILHEMMHFAGHFRHEDRDTSMVAQRTATIGELPLQNKGTPSYRFDLIASDREFIRYLYPDATAESDVALTNGAIDDRIDSELPSVQVDVDVTGWQKTWQVAARFQRPLCAPAVGALPENRVQITERSAPLSSFDNSNHRADVCTDSPYQANRVCKGQKVNVAYTIMNLGTEELVPYKMHFYFSRNTELGSSDILALKDSRWSTLYRGESSTFIAEVPVPDLGTVGEWWVIPYAEVDTYAMSPEESVRNNWIPARAPVVYRGSMITSGGASRCN